MSATTPMLLLLGLLTLVVPLMGVTMALTPYLMPKRECFAVTVPDDAAADPYLRRLKRTYLAIMLALTAAATIACAAALALDPEHAFVAALVAAALVLCLGGYGLMLYFRAKVQRYKKAQGWVAEGRRSAGFVGDEPFPKPLSLAWGLLYVPVILITLTMGIVGYPAMPDKVPLHMDLAGKVTEWADKSSGIVAFPVLFVVLIAVCLTVAHWMILRSKKGSDPATGARSLVCNAETAEGLFDADYPNPREIGADRVADAVAARALYGAPVVVVDFGTATNIEVIDRDGRFRGGVIAPGVQTSANALFTHGAQLPDIALVAPPAVIGTNTVEAIQSGIMLGEADRVDGLVRRIFDQLGYPAKVIATGGLAPVVERYSSTIDEVNTELTLEGLRLIADRAYR